MIILEIIGIIFAAVILIAFAAFFIFGLHYISWFHWRPCKHCGHSMEFKGLKPDENNGHYLFHCPKCGAWQQIPKEDFFRQIDEASISNPYKDITL